jgi:hypothetical protein
LFGSQDLVHSAMATGGGVTAFVSPIAASPQKELFSSGAVFPAKHAGSGDAFNADFPPSQSMLEMMDAKDMKHLLQSSSAGAGIALGLTITGIFFARFYSVSSIPVRVIPSYIPVFEIIFSTSLIISLAVVTFVYARRINRLTPQHRSAHHLATLCLLCVTLFCLFPARAVSEMALGKTSAPNLRLVSLDSFLSTVSISSTLMYLWFTLRQCRLERQIAEERFTLESSEGEFTVIVAATVIYFIARLLSSVIFAIAFAALPLQSFFALLMILSAKPADAVIADQVVPVVLLTVYEISLIIVVFRSSKKTSAFLASVDATDYRIESITHRFFKMSVSLLAIPAFVASAFQFGFPIKQALAYRKETGYLLLSPAVGSAAVGLLSFYFAGRQSFINLPSDTDGIFDWMRGRGSAATGPGHKLNLKPRKGKIAPALSPQSSSNSQPSTKVGSYSSMLTYRAIDGRDRDRGHPTRDPQCFVLESAVLLFNCSWMVYTYGTVGFRSANPSDFGKEYAGYRVLRHIEDIEHDVHALVIDGDDRIIVCFKGSNSVANAMTDKDTRLLSASEAFKGIASPAHRALPGVLLHGESAAWRGCKVHSGFAINYSKVRVAILSAVKELYTSCPRPIYVCGQYV